MPRSGLSYWGDGAAAQRGGSIRLRGGAGAGVKANCWSLAESAGHEGWGRMQSLLGSYRWDWTALRAALPALAVAWIPDSG